jgi:hypothetical protein
MSDTAAHPDDAEGAHGSEGSVEAPVGAGARATAGGS